MKVKDSILFKIKEIDIQISRIILNINKKNKINMTLTKGSILSYLENNEDMSITSSDLEKIVFLSKSSMSETITSLEKEGLIKRETSKIDNRKQFLTLTNKSKNLLENVREELDLIEKSILKNISDDEKKLFYEVLVKINTNLKERA